MADCVLAIDQGTTSTRCLLFDRECAVLGHAQAEHRQIYPQTGWVEHDPLAIWETTQAVIRGALATAGLTAAEVAAIGISNQRETVVIWDPMTGKPWLNAIVWQDTRTRELCDELAVDGGQDRFREATGLPLVTYFSGPKLRWALDHVDGLRQAAERGRAIAGTIDSWLIWQLTGGPDGGRHVTDVTNASRTMLMRLDTLAWDDALLDAFGIPRQMLPEIVPSSHAEAFGSTSAGVLGRAVPVAGALGDQQAALLGQCAVQAGDVKNTYGTGCFMLLHTGAELIHSRHGLLTTVAARLGDDPPQYALEGSVAIAGALVQWLRDNLGLIASSGEIEALARTVPDSAGIYFVPAFSGLFAPYWRSDARGVLVGLTHYVNRGHLARATLEATAYQARELLDAMRQDTGAEVAELRVDGGMVVNELLMQFQADLLGIPVVRPAFIETTVLGAAFAAGLATGFWEDRDALRQRWRADRTWQPQIDEAERRRLHDGWLDAVKRSFDLA